MVALVILAGSLLLFRQWRTPDVFVSGFGTSVDDNWPVGEPIYIGIGQERHDAQGSISINDAVPNVVLDETDARIEYSLCTVDVTSGVGSIGSADSTSIDQQCASRYPAEGQDMSLNAQPRQQVVMSVTPMRPGRIQVSGTSLAYTHGWQRGSQHLGDEVILTAVE